MQLSVVYIVKEKKCRALDTSAFECVNLAACLRLWDA